MADHLKDHLFLRFGRAMAPLAERSGSLDNYGHVRIIVIRTEVAVWLTEEMTGWL